MMTMMIVGMVATLFQNLLENTLMAQVMNQSNGMDMDLLSDNSDFVKRRKKRKRKKANMYKDVQDTDADTEGDDEVDKEDWKKRSN